MVQNNLKPKQTVAILPLEGVGGGVLHNFWEVRVKFAYRFMSKTFRFKLNIKNYKCYQVIVI